MIPIPLDRYIAEARHQLALEGQDASRLAIYHRVLLLMQRRRRGDALRPQEEPDGAETTPAEGTPPQQLGVDTWE